MDEIYKLAPNFFQNLMVTLYNYKAYKRRYGGSYYEFLKVFKANRNLSRESLIELQKERYSRFIEGAMSQSIFYRERFKDISDPTNLNNIRKLPILDKETLRTKTDEVVIQTDEDLKTAKTGGTTGKSLQVKIRAVNIQERFAMLDDFRSRFGYKLGKKTAWFSGKDLLTQRDIKKNRFWKKDYLNKVRYYSTFHMKREFIPYYIENLIRFKPEYVVGFPSSIFEIAKFGKRNNYEFPPNTVKAVFPTAETLSNEMRIAIESFFHTKVYDQYASSEGAPFIIECSEGELHLELQSGVFEVLDNNNNPATTGRLVVTSFTTEATPLIRYDIADTISLADQDKICSCGNNNPMALELHGRLDDYVFSPEMGKINIINVANAIKDVKGIASYQIVQNELNQLVFKIVADKNYYDKSQEKLFIRNWRDRVGYQMKFDLQYVEDIPVESSGKFRVVKNSIKHLVDA
ncbi:phenylacetate--CoA ligase family protein [Aequorivita marina]|uniref:phenylacetate--CoA ligase family protein n=1 Tax=Aequorivita marina TaxID=3073654 RepID=UPI002874FA90|nr:phenylacetate--CoA ligase family protein [Aequorivita sp. S2608]MDS1299046.1 phenylacetate--CoA ligase family protein [Aequorivita sp. S2608]